MANVYFKNNNQYYQLSYTDIDAAALYHKHDISDLGIMNFRNNGCTGQNILNNYDTEHANLLFYVPQINSDIVYAKRIPNDIIDNYDTTIYYNNNKTYNLTITNTDPVLIDSDQTTCYEYMDINNIITEQFTTLTSNYYYYYYPININYINNDFNILDIITITFETNLPISDNEHIFSITFHPIINNSKIEKYYIDKTLYPKISYTNIINLGLIYKANIIEGFCIICKEKLENQCDIKNLYIQINTNKSLSIQQNYIDYYDLSNGGIPPLESSGSLGIIDRTKPGYNWQTINDVIRYYRSYKFKNLLTWGQKIPIAKCIIPGYCNNTNYKQGYFILHIPYEFDIGIRPEHISLVNYEDDQDIKGYIWGGGGAIVAANGKILTKSNTPVQDKIAYNIQTIAPGMIGINMYWYTAPTSNISYLLPLKFTPHWSGDNLHFSIKIDDYN